MANNERTVDLNVRGKDNFSGTLDKLSKAQQKIIEQNQKIAKSPPGDLRKFYQDTQREVEAAEKAIVGLRAQFENLTKAEGDNRRQIAQLVVEKAKLQARAGELRASLDGVRQAAHQLRTTQQGGFSAFNATATAMEREARAARDLAAARAAANARLRDSINDRLNNPVRSNFSGYVDREAQATAASNARAAEQEALAIARATAETQRKIAIQERLGNVVKSGYADWSRYADQIVRIANEEQRSSAIAARKIAIQERLNNAANSGYLAWSRTADGFRAETTAANQTAAALVKVEQATNRAAGSQRKLATEVSNAAQELGGKGSRRGDSGGRKGEDQDIELYGLRPYQMVNLGYQLNDVISGLAMGQAPVQILAQQAGQVAQIWPEMMVGLVRSIPQIAALAAVFGPFIAAIARVKTEAATLQTFQRNLAFLADGSRYSADGLAKFVAELDRAGVKLEDARKGVMALVKDGFSEQQIRAIADMARNLSKLTGESFESEIRRVGTAFSGNAESIRDLDRELQFLTATQLQSIYSMERAGDKAGAMQAAQDALQKSLAASRKEMTPWETSVKNLSSAWNSLIETLASSSLLQDFVRDLGNLAKDFERITRGLDAASNWVRGQSSSDPAQVYQNNIERRSYLQTELKPYEGQSDPFYAMQAAQLRQELVEINAEIKDYEDGLKRAAATTAATTAATGVLVGTSQEKQKIEVDIQQSLDARLAAMQAEADLAAQTQREQFIQKEILDQQNEARKKGLDLSTRQLDTIRAAAGALFDAQNSPAVTGNYGSIVDRIVGVESGGNPNAKNPNSTATGVGQFIESTWLSMFRKYFPDEAQRMGKDAILELRKDSRVSRQLIDLYARENSAILKQAGVSVSDAAVYLSHFLGPQGAINTLKAAPNAQTSTFLTGGQISANRSILEGKTAAEVVAWAERKMAVTDQQIAGQTRLNELQDEEAKRQADYVKSYKARIADQQFELDLATKTSREAAIAKALRDEELKAKEAGLALSQEQRAEIQRTAAATFDQQNAMTQVNELLEQRALLADSLQIAQDAGDSGKVQQIVEQIRATEDQMNSAIDAAIIFYQAMGGPSADAAIAKLENLRATVGDVVKDLNAQFLPTAEQLNEQLADVGADAFSAFAQSVANGENALKSMWDAARQGIAQFLIDIGRAIVKQALFNAISGGSAGGGAGGWISSAIGGLFGARHAGGIVGAAAPTRMVNPAIFANAAYHHNGGVIGGLKPNEVPIIALKEEEMLTRDDPRHVLNGGKNGGQGGVKVVNVLSGAEVMMHALADEVGQRAIINWMTQNRTTISAALGTS